MHELSFRYATPQTSTSIRWNLLLMLVLPLFISEKLLFYYSLSFRLKRVKTNTLEAIHHRDTECTEENFFIVKNHKLLFTTVATLSHPYDRDIRHPYTSALNIINIFKQIIPALLISHMQSLSLKIRNDIHIFMGYTYDLNTLIVY